MSGERIKDFVVAGLLLGAGVLLAPWNPHIAAALASMGLEHLKQGIFDKGPDDPESQAAQIRGIKANVRSTQAPIPVVYGVTRVGLRMVDIRVISAADGVTPLANPALLFTGADDNDVLALVGALAQGSENGTGIQAVDNIRVFDDGVDAIQSPGLFSAAPSNTGVISRYDSKLKYVLEDGDDSQTAQTLVKNSLGWGTDMKGVGIAYGAFFMKFDQDVWSGIPEITAEVTGNRVYDPRSDAYIGFSAVKTSVSSDNPALCILDYLTSKRYGGGVPYAARDGGGGDDFIHEQSFVDAANYCDALVSAPPTTEKRFRMNAAVDTRRTVGRNLAQMMTACRGELVWQGGTYRLVINQVTTAESFELTEDNIVGSLDWVRKGATPNLIEAVFADAQDGDFNPNTVVWPLSGDTTLFDEDNEVENRAEVGLPFTTGYYQALRTIMVRLRESRNDVLVSLTATQEAYKLQVGEVVKITHEGPGWDRVDFRVRQIALTPDGLVRISLQQYTAAAYTLDTLVAQPSSPTTNLPDPHSIAVPTSVAATSDVTTTLETQDGFAVPRIKLAWTPPSDTYLAGFNVRFRDDSAYGAAFEAGPDANKEDASIFIWPVSEGVAYTVEVRSVNTIGVASAWVSVTVTVVTLPAVRLRDVRAFPDVPSAGNVTAQWSRSSSTYEIWAFVRTLVLPVDDDDDPWPGDATEPTSVLAAGTDSIVVTEPASGSITYLQLEPRSWNGTPGRLVRATVDPASVSIEIAPPTWGIITESEGATDGTFKVKLYDPDAVMDDVYYRTKAGPVAWTAYAVQDASPTNLDEYQRTVTMVEAHQSYIEFRGRYTINGVQHTTVISSSGFDFGKAPNLSISATVDEAGIFSANVQGDADTASIKILASKVSSPSATDTRAETAKNGRVFTTADIGTLATLAVGETGYITAFGYSAVDGGGDESTQQYDVVWTRPGEFKPEVFVKEVRAAAVSTVTIDVTDTFRRVTAIEYKKRDGAEGGDTLDSSWQTAWTSSVGTTNIASADSGTGTNTIVEVGAFTNHVVGDRIVNLTRSNAVSYIVTKTSNDSVDIDPAIVVAETDNIEVWAVTLQRVINVPVAAGLEGELQWRVKYTDVNGIVQTFGDSFKVVNLEGTTRTITIPWTDLVSDIGSQWTSPYLPYTLYHKDGYAAGSDSGYAVNFATVVMPPGVTITKMIQVGYREETTNFLITNFGSYAFDGTARVNHATVINDTTGWQSKEETLSTVVDADRQYIFRSQLLPANGTTTWDGDDVRLACMKFEYTRPAYSYAY
jgi:hypothetical protein